MTKSSTQRARLRVWRGRRRGEGHFDEFAVPYEDGMSVLDALRWIRCHIDGTLAIRYSCINANACKTCVALVNGEVEYTCIAKLRREAMTIEPLATRPLIRDLVTDIVPEDERL
jgi:succinate dehydrogenase/fumarate reductase-like Fe-S protein